MVGKKEDLAAVNWNCLANCNIENKRSKIAKPMCTYRKFFVEVKVSFAFGLDNTSDQTN